MPRILFVSGFHPNTRARALAFEFERFGPLIRCDVPAPRNPHANTNPRVETVVESNRTKSTLGPPDSSRATPRPSLRLYRDRKSSSPFALIASESSNRSLNEPRNYRSYAFVEFRSTRDAEDAYYDMHGKLFDGSRLSIQWAKNPPSSVWRYDRGAPRSSRRSSRSRSPRRRGGRDRDRGDRDRDRDRDRGDREREREPRDRDRDRDRDGERDVDEDRDRDGGRDRDSRRSRRTRSRSPERDRRGSGRSRSPEPRRRSASPDRREEEARDRDDHDRSPPKDDERSEREKEHKEEEDAQTPS